MKFANAFLLSVLLLANTAYAQKLERINPPGLRVSDTYTNVVKVGKLLFLAGQLGRTMDGKLAGPSMKEQVDQALKNLTTALKSQGADLSHVAKLTIYVTSMNEYRAPEVGEVVAKHFGPNHPASTLLQIVQLAVQDAKVEIEAIAALP